MAHTSAFKGTYAAAQDVIFAALRDAGWRVSGPLKYRWAESPDGMVRVYLKARSIYAGPSGVPLGRTHSMWWDPKQLAALLQSGEETPTRFMHDAHGFIP